MTLVVGVLSGMPRVKGMMQKVQKSLQPSSTLTMARVRMPAWRLRPRGRSRRPPRRRWSSPSRADGEARRRAGPGLGARYDPAPDGGGQLLQHQAAEFLALAGGDD